MFALALITAGIGLVFGWKAFGIALLTWGVVLLSLTVLALFATKTGGR